MIANKVSAARYNSFRSVFASCINENGRQLITSTNNHNASAVNNNTQRRGYAPKQRKIDLTLQNPFDMLEAYKKKMSTIERIDENTPAMKPIYTEDVLLQRNIEIYEKLKQSGTIPGM